MPDFFEQRNMKCAKGCRTCKYSICIELDYDFGNYDEYFCMLGVSDSDRLYVMEEVDKTASVLYQEWNPHFLQIMKINEDENLSESPRLVGSGTYCQFYKNYMKLGETK